MAMHFFHPEMGEQRHPESQIEASLCHYGNHYYIKTPLELKGRGIKKGRTLTAEMLVPQAWRKIGWHEYTVTLRAMERLAEQYTVTGEMLL